MKKLFKLSYEYILLFLQILFIALFVLVLLAYNLDIAEKNFLESRMFSENVQGIQLGDKRVDKDVTVEIPEINNSEFMMYKNLVDSGEIVRGVYGTGDIFGFSSYISEGRFFNADDYAKQTRAVVIGPGILPRTTRENGKRYFPYDQRMYEVVGVFSSTDTVLDNAVYINLTSLLGTENNMALYYVDALNPDTVNKVLSELQAYAEGKYISAFVKYEPNVEYFGLTRTLDALLIFAVLAAVFNLLITIISFVTHKKYKVAVQKLYGMTSRNLAWNYGRSIFAIIAASFISVILVIVGTSRHMGALFTLDKLAGYHYGIMGGILILLWVAMVYFIVKLAGKVNISDTLKGR
jgi:hypothetical protein